MASITVRRPVGVSALVVVVMVAKAQELTEKISFLPLVRKLQSLWSQPLSRPQNGPVGRSEANPGGPPDHNTKGRGPSALPTPVPFRSTWSRTPTMRRGPVRQINAPAAAAQEGANVDVNRVRHHRPKLLAGPNG